MNSIKISVLCTFVWLQLLSSSTVIGQSLQRKGKLLIYNGEEHGIYKAAFLFDQDTLCSKHYDLHIQMNARKNFTRNAGLILLGAGTALHILSNIGDTDQKQLFHQRFARTLPLILFGVTGTALLLNSASRRYKHIDKAIDCYNFIGESAKPFSEIEGILELSLTANGVGFVYNF